MSESDRFGIIGDGVTAIGLDVGEAGPGSLVIGESGVEQACAARGIGSGPGWARCGGGTLVMAKEEEDEFEEDEDDDFDWDDDEDLDDDDDYDDEDLDDYDDDDDDLSIDDEDEDY